MPLILREPLGVIGVVTPWNHPPLMAAWKIAPILAAGNTLVLKPSEQTPLTTLKCAELVADLLPAGVLNVVNGRGPVVGARLAEHPDVGMIALTGSVAGGRAVARAAAESLKRVHLELGGKAPVVVFEDADLAAAASSLRVAGFWNSAAREEIFGPVVTVETLTDEDEAVRRANGVPLGLSTSAWTENARRSHDVAARLDFGTVWVNSQPVLAGEVPWGGFKGSGYGRDLSLHALDDYSRTKHVMHNHER
ncbi:aldehyde dehydrogenase family protein [Streptomyces sp. NPDC057616]|uniref:aldehyde dehydrogenase family protein n=1 Tax=Streptomyces sp. NPDC057616 TaxID=3346183 RepID=UPI0036AFF66C